MAASEVDILRCRGCGAQNRVPRARPNPRCGRCKTPFSSADQEEADFNQRVEEEYDARAPDFRKTLNIAFVGKVSSGKSSLINAFLRRKRGNTVVTVGAVSGVTTKLKCLRLDAITRIVDSPGLDDIRKENSEVTKGFLESIDVGILVVTGSADASQKRHYNDLRSTCNRVFVVLNKVDEWDKLKRSALDDVVAQWKSCLSVDRIFPVCAFGYDPQTDPQAPMDIRGVDQLREEVEQFLATEGKDLFLARQMGEKSSYAIKIVVGALLAVAGEAFLPGSAVFISATQGAAICALYYLHTGRILSKTSALALLPVFAAEAVGSTLFLWAKSLLPPTGIVDAAAAAIAVSVTLAMLVAVNALLAEGAELEDRERLRTKFASVRMIAESTLKDSGPSDWLSADFWKRILRSLMYA